MRARWAEGTLLGEPGEVAEISEVVTSDLSPHRASLAGPLTLFYALISNRIQLEIQTLFFSPFLSKIFYHEKFQTYRRSENSVMNGQASTLSTHGHSATPALLQHQIKKQMPDGTALLL